MWTANLKVGVEEFGCASDAADSKPASAAALSLTRTMGIHLAAPR